MTPNVTSIPAQRRWTLRFNEAQVAEALADYAAKKGLDVPAGVQAVWTYDHGDGYRPVTDGAPVLATLVVDQ